MAIPKGHEANYNTLLRAAKNNDLVLMETQDAKTGELVYAVCAIQKNGEEFQFVPLAKLFNGNPYEELNPPNPKGGFHVNGRAISRRG